MKRLLILLALVAGSAAGAFTQEAEEAQTMVPPEAAVTAPLTTTEENEIKNDALTQEELAQQSKMYSKDAEQILERGKKAFKGKNKDELKDLVFHIQEQDRVLLYNQFKKSGAGAKAFFNWIPGFGSGSYSQGDALGGTVILLSDIATSTAVVVGAFSLVGALAVAIFEAPLAAITGTDTEKTDQIMTFAAGSFLVGGVLWVCARIFGTVRPFAYNNAYNKKLRNALGLDKNMKIVPVVSVPTNEYGLVATLKL